MFLSTLVISLALLFTPYAQAGTAAQNACGNSFTPFYTVRRPVNYPPGDNSAMTWRMTYSTSACTASLAPYVFTLDYYNTGIGAYLTVASSQPVTFPGTGDKLIQFNTVAGGQVSNTAYQRSALSTGTNYQITAYLGNTGSQGVYTAVSAFTVTHAAGTVPSAGLVRRADQVPMDLRCPTSEQACNVAGTNMGWECIKVSDKIDSCGACPGEAGSMDCTGLPNIAEVSCVGGRCQVHDCEDGFAPASNGTMCLSV